MIFLTKSAAGRVVGTALTMLALAGCSSAGDSSGSTFGRMFGSSGSSAPAATADATGAQAAYCPSVTIQPGTAAYAEYERGQEGSMLAVRNQARFGDIVRECTDVGGQTAVRIGVSGRLMLGPKGSAGVGVPVPVRFVVLDEDNNPVISRVTRIQTTIPPGQTGISFTHVEDLGVLPVSGRGWSLRIGFDSPAGKR